MQDKGWYLPKWEDDNLWKRWHDKKIRDLKGYELNGFKTRYPNKDAFKDHCFKYLKENMKDCHPSDGHCTECIWSKEWDKELLN